MTTRVGIPRALQFYQHYPLWRTWLEDLGLETVVSPPTNREIVTAGAKTVADVTCLPVKVYAGHVCWLRDHGGVDFAFSPAIWSLEPGAFHCSKFKGLPDIMKATIPDCPPLIDPEVDPHGRRLEAASAFARVARRFAWSPLKRQRAWEHAQQVDRDYRTLMVREQLTYPEALVWLYGPGWITAERIPNPKAPLTVGLVGHPYCLYDDYLNHNLVRRLGDLGVNVITSEMVAPEAAERGIALTTGETRWFYDRWMSGAAGHFLQSRQVDGLIAGLAFACGPDSTMMETIMRRAHRWGQSCMSLVLDEHGSATGMVTRLEAFVDMLLRQKAARTEGPPQTAASAPSGAAPAVIHRGRPVLGIPTMGTTAIPVRSMFRGIGAQVQMGPPVSKRTVLLGSRNSPEFICTPYKQLLGNMIEMLEAGADTLIYVDGLDLCRNSSYHQLMRDALTDLGYQFRLLTFGQLFQGGVFAMPAFLRQFAPEVTWRDTLREVTLGLRKAYALDTVERRVQYLRPREANAGEADKVWSEALLRLDEATDAPSLKLTERDLLARLDKLPMNPEARPVKVAITGEIFAVLDPFYNLDVERELGKLGVEVHRTLMISNWAKANLILEAIGLAGEPEIERSARPYLRWNVSGEGWQTIGETVIHARQGFDGMVELLPFTCEPEITALNILPKVSRDYDIPVIPFIFDEQSGRAGMRTRLEAFVDLLYRRREMRERSRLPVPASELPRTTRAGEDLCRACPVRTNCSPARRPAGCKLEPQELETRRAS